MEEWSRGANPVLLSEIKREFQLSVHLCDNLVSADVGKNDTGAAGSSLLEQCGLGKDIIFNKSTGGDLIEDYAWSLTTPDGILTGENQDFTTNLLTPGTYAGTLVVNPSATNKSCRDTANFMLEVLPGSTANFTSNVESTTVTFLSNSAKANALDWDFGDGLTSTDTDPVHTYAAPGVYVVSLLAHNDACVDTLRQEINVASPNSIRKLAELGVSFSPNPTGGIIYLEGPASITAVFDLRGRMITDFRPREIDLSSKPKGVYLVWINTGGATHSVRVIRQ
ncbi:MAG: PKD domain-containing protein [Bacteroidota bacterium]